MQTLSRWLMIFFREIRFYQFSKNLLIFVPLFSGHFFNLPGLVSQFILGFFVFCCVAGSGYILNDFCDLSYDRVHPNKANRPLAKGELSVNVAVLMMAVLFVLGLGLSLVFLPINFSIVLVTYYLLCFAYSHYLKRIVLADVFTLSFFYSLRIMGGMFLIPITGFSNWLIMFSFFFFLSLAYIKRYSELARLSQEGHANNQAIAGRNYFPADLQQLGLFGVVSAFAATLILMLYINSANVVQLYHTPQLLWMICFINLFWLLRIWVLVGRGLAIEDPVMFALRDKLSLAALSLIGVIYMLASI